MSLLERPKACWTGARLRTRSRRMIRKFQRRASTEPMPSSGFDRQGIAQISVHEAGHLACALLLPLVEPPAGAKVWCMDGVVHGLTHFARHHYLSDADEIWNLLLMTESGSSAEVLAGYRPRLHDDDASYASELALALCGSSGDQVARIRRRAHEAAMVLLAAHRQGVWAITDRLRRDGHVDASTAVRLLSDKSQTAVKPTPAAPDQGWTTGCDRT